MGYKWRPESRLRKANNLRELPLMSETNTLPTSQALNRRSAETAMNRALPTYRSFPDIDAAKAWMDLNQLGRRNLTKEKRDEMIRRLAASGVEKKDIAQAVGLDVRRIQQIAQGGRKNFAENQINAVSPSAEIESLQRKLEEAEAARRSTEQRR